MLRGASLMAAALLSASCGGGSDTTSTDELPSVVQSSATVTPTPTEDTSIYLLTNREQFLAGGPDCSAMTAWYAHNPVDVDPGAIARYVEQCDAFPPELVGNSVAIEDSITPILGSAMPMSDPVRGQVHQLLADDACETFDSGTRSPYAIGTDVADRGGTPEDYRAVIQVAAISCPEHRDDLTVFSAPDVVAAGDQLATFVSTNWPQAVGTFPEWMAAAQYVCTEKQGRAEGAAMFVELITGPEEVDKFVLWTHENLC